MPNKDTIVRKAIRIEDIQKKIEVTPPYFALEDISMDEDSKVFARIPVQHQLGMEIDPIVAAEAGRHLAILGSCAVAMVNPDAGKHFYLAYHADLNYIGNFKITQTSSMLGEATGEFVNKRTAKAACLLLSTSGQPVYSLVVFYHVLRESVFHRLYSDKYVHSNSLFASQNPYTEAKPLYNSLVQDNQLTASMGKVHSEWCAGHFDNYPALPVAVLMHNLSVCVGHHLRHMLNANADIKYSIIYCLTRADQLAFEGESIHFESTFLSQKDDLYSFRSKAYTDENKIVGEAELTFKLMAMT